jgi:hypothetical protein
MQNEPAVKTIKENFQFYIKDLRFHYGGVSFRHFVPTLQKRLDFTIINYSIREEFDAVKDYFINVFGSKKVEVKTLIQMAGDEVKLIEAHSPQIESIDDRLLKTVKIEFIKDITDKKFRLASEKTILTMDEFFETLMDKEFKASGLYSHEMELAEDLVKVAGSKHYNHLRFLSGRHAYKVMRLRFILKPFSFLFLLEGERSYHLVWETLDTEEATYLWPVEKDKNKLKEALQNIADTIGMIKAQGKKVYLHSSEDPCKRILHNYSLGIEGFIKWRDEVESVLT